MTAVSIAAPAIPSCPAPARPRRRRIEPKQEAIEVVISDGACRPPGRELAEGPEFRHSPGDTAAIRCHREPPCRPRKPSRSSSRTVKAAMAVDLEGHHRLAEETISPGSATRMPTVPSAGAISLVLSSSAWSWATVASASATRASARARSSAVGPALASAGWARFRSRSAWALASEAVLSSSFWRLAKFLRRQRGGARRRRTRRRSP